MSEKSFHPPPGQSTDPEKEDHVELSMSGNDYPPPGQHTITDFPAKQDRVETMPRAQQYIPPGQQPTAPQMGQAQPMRQQQQYVQQVPGQYYQQQQQQQPQYNQPMTGQAQYYQQQQQQQPQYNQPMTGQQYSGGAGSIERPGGQSPTPFLYTPLQPWTTELFDCAQDMENAVITAFFPCITFGQIAEITDQGMSNCTGAGLIYGLLLYFTGLHWVYSWMFRTRMRAQYSLAEDPCHDCLVSAFCDACALCQEYRELQNRGFNMQLGWVGNMQLRAQKEAAAGVPPPVQGMTR